MLLITDAPTTTPREAIEAAFAAIQPDSYTIVHKISDVARSIEGMGSDMADRVTTRMIRRQLIASGRG